MSSNIFKANTLGYVSSWLAIFLVFGYPISAAIPILLRISSTPINFGFRVIYVLLSLFLIIGGLVQKERINITKGGFYILLFWLFYSIRLIYDVSVRGLVFNSPLFVYSFAFGNCLIPSIAIILTARFIKVDELSKKLLKLIIASNLIILFLTIYMNGLSMALFFNRITFNTGLSGEANVLNPITISFTGEVLALLSLIELFLNKNKNKIKFILLFFIGFGILVLGASRGPMLSFLFCFLIILFFYFKTVKRTFNNIVIIFIKGIVIFSLFFAFIKMFLNKMDFMVLSRLIDLAETGNTSNLDARPLLFKRAWEQFVENPILGDQYLCDYLNFYPHNIYLEVLMALGITGGVIFIAILFNCFKRGKYLLIVFNKSKLDIFLLLIAILFAGLTSGSLFTGISLWVWLSLFCSIKIKERLTL